ncbi:MAG: DUF3006 domain-containing protein [Firmicutes bacterium]|nr:DUF3006 domain-containing protein [Bacillota bacterium]
MVLPRAETAPASGRVRAILDRVEGDIAILANWDDERERFEMPARLLPPGAREGDVVNVDLTIDTEATRLRREAVEVRIKKLLRRREADYRAGLD